jgi:myo-inositol 2-dehydrogenase/D-chiro-inositol 1-dehydrogenase
VSEPFRLALVGAGRMGGAHAAAIAGSERVSIAAVCDPAPAAAARAAAWGARWHADLDGLLAAGGIDGALVAAPTRLHRPLVERLAGAGLPILCEKPCGLDLAEGEHVVRAAERAGVPFLVGYWRRHVPELRALQERIAAGALGGVQLVRCWHWDEHPPPPAFRDPASSGGILVDVCVHEFDLARWLCGSPVAALAGFEGGVRSAPEVPGDPESVALAGRLGSGTALVVSAGRRRPGGDAQIVEVIGTEGAAVVPFAVGAAGAAVIAAALRRQAEDLAAVAGGAAPLGAGGADALAALAAADCAARALLPAASRR